MTSSTGTFLAVAVGNSRTRVGVVEGGVVGEGHSFPNDDVVGLAAQIHTLLEKSATQTVVTASVNNPVADRLEATLGDAGTAEILRIGRDIEIPILHSLDDATTVGHDRLLCALGAFSKSGQACVVVDCGTAITVDFVDGVGAFQGGVIAPGVNMMLRALHERTAALPQLEFALPDPARGEYGKDTRHAMMLGARNAAVGLVRRTIELFAVAYEAYPQIVATGGDAAALFAEDDLVEHIVPDLQLIGIAQAWRAAAEADE
ncbi:MAG: type III pantothenate kinase [Planctomycetota bacterium]